MRFIRPLLYVWAFPATALGLLFVPLAWLTGGTVRIVRGALEVRGGLVATLLRQGLPLRGGGGAALTLGHVILGRDQGCLDRSRDHEHVHVKQFERWGPFLLPMYFAVAWILHVRGFDAHLDHPFEREAYERGR